MPVCQLLQLDISSRSGLNLQYIELGPLYLKDGHSEKLDDVLNRGECILIFISNIQQRATFQISKDAYAIGEYSNNKTLYYWFPPPLIGIQKRITMGKLKSQGQIWTEIMYT